MELGRIQSLQRQERLRCVRRRELHRLLSSARNNAITEPEADWVLQARAQKASAAAGELAKKLEAQKKQTRAQTLEQASYENRAARDADAALEARNYN